MTLIGKLLAFLNLAVGIGIVSWSTSVYFQRPGYFDPIPETIDKGSDPVSFAQLKQDIDALGKTASLASAAWGKELKILEDTEKRRADRLKEYDQRYVWMHKGNPKEKGAAFFEAVYEKDASGKNTSMIDITKLGKPVPGPGKGAGEQPLKGIDNLLDTFNTDVKEVIKLEALIEIQLKEYDRLGTEILREEARLLSMFRIRESVQSELFHLSSFELNVYETRGTVFLRKNQLVSRLAELGINIK